MLAGVAVQSSGSNPRDSPMLSWHVHGDYGIFIKKKKDKSKHTDTRWYRAIDRVAGPLAGVEATLPTLADVGNRVPYSSILIYSRH